jgi:hypothetical protein
MLLSDGELLNLFDLFINFPNFLNLLWYLSILGFIFILTLLFLLINFFFLMSFTTLFWIDGFYSFVLLNLALTQLRFSNDCSNLILSKITQFSQLTIRFADE